MLKKLMSHHHSCPSEMLFTFESTCFKQGRKGWGAEVFLANPLPQHYVEMKITPLK